MKNRNSLRVVIDTNTYVSALVFGGKPRLTLEWWLEHGSIIISAEILTELRRVVRAKFPDFIDELSKLEKLLERDAVRVDLGSVHVAVCRDPDDNRVIETALIGNCRFIVSGDKDLLVLAEYEWIVMVSPAMFMNSLK